MISVRNLTFSHKEKIILNNITTDFQKGQITAVIGTNGSGKSSLARHLNALYLPQCGVVEADGISANSADNIYNIRKSVGMIFQDPALGAVASIVEDDIAFGLENAETDSVKSKKIIDSVLKTLNIESLRKRRIKTLSGGEKQLVAIAGVLALNPRYIIFDESTSMLDPLSKNKIFDLAKQLSEKDGLGIIWITQNMEEAARCDCIKILHNGILKASEKPEVIFKNSSLIAECGLDTTNTIKLSYELKKMGIDIGVPLSTYDAAERIAKIVQGEKNDFQKNISAD